MDKIKSKAADWAGSEAGKDILTVLIVILVGLGSFGLGRLSKQALPQGLQVEFTGEYEAEANIVQALAPSPAPSGGFFASSKGSKFYSLGCSGGKTIKQENRSYFNTRGEGESAGVGVFTPG